MSEWDDKSIKKLRALWAEGVSVAEIGRRMNLSKNAVVGKAHRLYLPPRPSPIRRGDAGEVKEPSLERRRKTASPAKPVDHALAAAAHEADVPNVVQPVRKFSDKPCAWPIGEPGKPSFHFCNDLALDGKPYCQHHDAIAYVRVRDRREDAA